MLKKRAVVDSDVGRLGVRTGDERLHHARCSRPVTHHSTHSSPFSSSSGAKLILFEVANRASKAIMNTLPQLAFTPPLRIYFRTSDAGITFLRWRFIAADAARFKSGRTVHPSAPHAWLSCSRCMKYRIFLSSGCLPASSCELVIAAVSRAPHTTHTRLTVGISDIFACSRPFGFFFPEDTHCTFPITASTNGIPPMPSATVQGINVQRR